MLIFDKKTLQYIEVENNFKKPFYIVSIICFFLILSLSYSFYLLSIQSKELKRQMAIKCEIENFNIQSMKQVDSIINELPFSDKATCKKQYRIESNNLKSDLVMKNKNCFGMKASSRRHTYVGIDKNGYAIYSSIYMSIVDRLLYDIYVGTSLKGYASDKNYLKKLNIKK
jgi:hypothetical protein